MTRRHVRQRDERAVSSTIAGARVRLEQPSEELVGDGRRRRDIASAYSITSRLKRRDDVSIPAARHLAGLGLVEPVVVGLEMYPRSRQNEQPIRDATAMWA